MQWKPVGGRIDIHTILLSAPDGPEEVQSATHHCEERSINNLTYDMTKKSKNDEGISVADPG